MIGLRVTDERLDYS